jgi:DNA-directed RNA polymerase subunit RPC12/RpoP
MSTIEFVKDEIQEALAVDAFKAYRLKQGVICKKCGSKRHYWLANKQQFQCVSCRFKI